MLEIIKERTKETVVDYFIDFVNKEDSESGFSFPANSDGTIALDKMPDCAKANYEMCLSDDRFIGPEFNTRTFTYTDPAVGKCVCGKEVILESGYYGAVSCECGRWYNLFGQELKDPKYWEEDYDY